MPIPLQPMPLRRRSLPFDDPDWIYELKMDGFRALAIVEHGRAQLLSRNGHPFASFSALAESISDSLPNVRAVIDGEICSLDRRGRPQFKNLLFRRGNPPCFFAFDLLTRDGKDLRAERLLDHLDGSGAGNPNSGYAILGYPIREHFTLTAYKASHKYLSRITQQPR